MFSLLQFCFLASAFFASSLPLTLAQELPEKLTCQARVNEVITKIQREGVEKIKTEVRPRKINHPDNPTSRSDELIVVMIPTNRKTALIIDDIINSATLLRVWSDAIVESCGNTAIIRFKVARSNFVRAYYVQYDGKTRQVECVKFTVSDHYPWGTEYCPDLVK
jgi:hypothetical protein